MITAIQDALCHAYAHANTRYLQDEFKINEKRYFETLKILTSLVPKKSTVLEVGCSPCVFTLALSQLDYSMYGIDLDPNVCLELARGKELIKKCDLDHDYIPFVSDMFDCIIFAAVFEHLHPFRTKFVMQEIYRCLKPKGILIFSTPNLFALENRIFMLFGGTNALGGGITPTHHTREYGMKEINRILKEVNFKIESEYYSTARDLVRVHEMWKNIGRKILYPAKKIIPSFRSCIFVIATKL